MYQNEKLNFLSAFLPTLRDEILNYAIDSVSLKDESYDNIVTDLDIELQNKLVKVLLERYPNTTVLAEESNQQDVSDALWIIDPIDGTKNYYRRREDFAISIAYYQQHKPIFGIVYDVAKDDLFVGLTGQGAWLNHQRLSPVKAKSIHETILDMNLKTLYALQARGAQLEAFNQNIFAHRNIGSAALSLCRMANGQHEFYFSSHLKLWDIAAAKIILEEVGGLVLLPDESSLPMDDRSFVLIALSSKSYLDDLKQFRILNTI
jgi:myo-inositol-1(or 4)-monophosphatase